MAASARKKAAASPAQDDSRSKSKENTPGKEGKVGRRKSAGSVSGSKKAPKQEPQPQAEPEDEEEEAEAEQAVAVAVPAIPMRGAPKGKAARAPPSAESLSFFKMSSRMMSAGRATAKHLLSKAVSQTDADADVDADADADAGASSKKGKGKKGFVMASSWAKPSNAIESAQHHSSLYDSKVGSTHSLLKSAAGKAKRSLGKGWFDAAPAELTSELKSDMKVVQMRNYLDPKRFYKNPDKMKNVIGVGTVIEGPDEFISQRLTRKERKQSLVGEILADSQIKEYTKRKYAEIQTEKERNSFRKKKQSKMGQRKGVGSGGRKIRKLY